MQHIFHCTCVCFCVLWLLPHNGHTFKVHPPCPCDPLPATGDTMLHDSTKQALDDIIKKRIGRLTSMSPFTPFDESMFQKHAFMQDHCAAVQIKGGRDMWVYFKTDRSLIVQWNFTCCCQRASCHREIEPLMRQNRFGMDFSHNALRFLTSLQFVKHAIANGVLGDKDVEVCGLRFTHIGDWFQRIQTKCDALLWSY